MKKKYVILSLIIALCISLCKLPYAASAECECVYLGGMPAGFRIDNRGATIIGLNDVISSDGLYSPAKDAGIRAGDLMLTLDGKEINSAADIGVVLSDYDGNGITATIEREGEIIIKIVYPAKDISGKYRMGMFVRDDVSGIGTITYIKENNEFGALGHPVTEGESQKALRINSGVAYGCNIIGVNRGVRGKAGEIRGYFIEDEILGVIEKNTAAGIFGKITDEKFTDGLKKMETGEAKPGKASLYSTVEGTRPKEYEITIVKADRSAAENKDLVVKITDEKLIEKTGGILQGMSGSPIVQNGKLVGAVTHVFLNDPTRGFGISIEKMIKE